MQEPMPQERADPMPDLAIPRLHLEGRKCEVCGNLYDKTMEVTLGGKSHVFDSFECAIEALAPRCAHCGCRIIGHGLEASGQFFCCDSCAESSGEHGLRDRA